VLDAVSWTLLRLASYLLTGQVGPRPSSSEEAQVGVSCLAYLRSRCCAPRDMSAPAAEQLRAACDVLLANSY
jgi:glutathione S-transferase